MPKILVVDDDACMRDTLKDCLEVEGHLVQLARNGSEALQLLHAGIAFELILTDLSMPVCDGRAFLAAKNKNEAWRKIPTLVLTGNPDVAGIQELIVRKPVGIDSLFQAIQAAMAGRTPASTASVTEPDTRNRLYS